MKLSVFASIILVVLVSCGQEKEKVTLDPESDAYKVAQEVSQKVSYVDPDQNNALVSCNTFEITTGEVFDLLVKNYRQQMDQFKALPPAQIDDAVQKFAENLASRKIYLNAAQKEGITADEEEVKRSIMAAKTRAGGEDRFQQWLDARSMDMEYFQRITEEELAIKAYINKEMGEAPEPTEQEILKEYQKDKTATVRHILLSTQGKSEDEKKEIRKKMEDILARARDGEDFAELAKEYTEDPGSKSNGGLYKDFPRGRMVPEFDKVSFSLPPGEISDIVETSYGYHIIKVIERKRETRPLGDIRENIVTKLKRSNRNGIRNNLLDELKVAAGYEKHEYPVEPKEGAAMPAEETAGTMKETSSAAPGDSAGAE